MDARLRVRRARRDDLDRVRALLGTADTPTPRERKRWRRLVSTLREDLYLAERDDDVLVGLAVIVYVRGLGAPAAVVRQLHGAIDAARVLLECARARALARGCGRLEVQLESGAPAGGALADALVADGWSAGPRTLVRALSA
jgi:hypothetical protein